MQNAFRQRLERGSILCDGAMGTLLYAKGISFARCFDELNLSEPALVQEYSQRLHRRWRRDH